MAIRVLVVDDDKDLLTLIEKFLVKEHPDFEVISTISAQDAVRKLEEERFDAIVCDYYLGVGEMNGLELLEWLRASQSSIPFIMFTGRSREEVAIRALNLGADLYLKKDQEDLGNLFVELVHHIKSSVESVQMEKTLREERSRFQKYLDVAGVMIVALDVDGRITLMNRKGCEILGYDCKEIIGMDWFKTFIPKSLRKEVHRAFTSLMKGDIEFVEYFENSILTKDGKERIIAWHNSVLTDESGKIAGTLSSGEDITERKRAEQAIQKSEERFRSVFEESPIGIDVFDSDGLLIEANKACLDVFGASSVDDLRGFCLFDDPNIPEEMKRRIRDGETVKFQNEFSFEKVKELELYETSRSGNAYLNNVIAPFDRDEDGSSHGYIVQMQDVTKRKTAEEALRASQQLLQRTFDSLNEAVIVLDAETVEIVDCNPATETIFGYSRHELMGKKVNMLHMDEATLEEFRENLYPAIEEKGFLDRFEFRMKRRDGTAVPTEHSVTPLKNEQGTRVGWVSVVRDISERKKTEDALRESEKRFRTVFEQAAVGVTIVEMDDNIIETNPFFQELIGYSADELITMKVADFTDPDDTAIDASLTREVLDGKRDYFTMEKRYIRKTGEKIWGKFSANFVKDEEGIPEFCIGIVEDITERKKAEEALVRSQKEKSAILNGMKDIVVYFDSPDMEIIWANRAAAESVDLSVDELIGEHGFKIWYQRDKPLDSCPVIRSFETGQPEEEEMTTPDGMIWVAWAWPVKDDEGRTTGVVRVSRNVTERKRAEEALRESESNFRSLAENTPDYIMRYDKECRHLYENPAALRVSGLTEENIIGKTHREAGFDEELCNFWEEKITAVFKTSQSSQTIFEWEGAEGKVSLDWRLVPEFDESGQVKTVLGISRDITEQKNLEETLRKSEQRNRLIVDTMSDLVFVYDSAGRYGDYFAKDDSLLIRPWNEIRGRKPEEIIPLDIAAQHNEHAKKVRETGESVTFEYELEIDNALRLFQGTMMLHEDNESIVVAVKDITERKLVEENLRQSEEKYRTIVRSISDIIFVHDKDDYYAQVYVSDEGLLTSSIEDFIGHHPSENVPPNLLQLYLEASAKVRDTGMSEGFEFPLTVRGKDKWFASSLTLHEDGESIISVTQDITERKLAEENLRQSEKKYRSLFDNTPVGLTFQEIVVDESGRPIDFVFIDVNEGFEALMGLRKDDIVGKSASHVLTSSGETELNWIDVYGKVALTGARARFEQYSEALGRWFSVTAYSPEKNSFITAYTDITEQKRAYEDLKQQKKELSDFAHTMSHDLNTYFFKFRGLVHLLESKDEIPEIRRIQLLIAEMSNLVQHSVILADAGLVIDKKHKVDLAHLVRDVAVRHLPEGIAIVQGPLLSVMADEISLIQIFQNLFENAVEHGTPKTVEVQRHDSMDGVRIVVANDGKQIPNDSRPKVFQSGFTTKGKSRGFGLSIVKKLVEAHGWQIRLVDTPETAFEILIPSAAG